MSSDLKFCPVHLHQIGQLPNDKQLCHWKVDLDLRKSRAFDDMRENGKDGHGYF
jgi:hypothetical protein